MFFVLYVVCCMQGCIWGGGGGGGESLLAVGLPTHVNVDLASYTYVNMVGGI